MSTPTPRDRATKILQEYEWGGTTTQRIDSIERAITAAEQAARADERRKFTARGGWPNTSGTDSERERGAFRRGAEAMREQIEKSLAVIGDMDLAINAVRYTSPPQPDGGGE